MLNQNIIIIILQITTHILYVRRRLRRILHYSPETYRLC
jgi:hypothetical protein